MINVIYVLQHLSTTTLLTVILKKIDSTGMLVLPVSWQAGAVGFRKSRCRGAPCRTVDGVNSSDSTASSTASAGETNCAAQFLQLHSPTSSTVAIHLRFIQKLLHSLFVLIENVLLLLRQLKNNADDYRALQELEKIRHN